MKPMRIGLYGCGNRTVQLLQEAEKCPDVQVTLCHDLNWDRAEALAKRYNARPCTLDELLTSDEVDMYLVSLFPAAHTQALLNVAKTGKPVYIEKPVVVTMDDIKKLIPLIGKNYVQVGLFYNYIPIYRELLRLVQSGLIGDLVGINFNWLAKFIHPEAKPGEPTNWRLVPETGGELTQHYCHCFDWFRSLGGNFKSMVAMTNTSTENRTCVEDLWDLIIKQESGSQISFHGTEINPRYTVYGYLEGTKATLEWEWNNPSRIVYCAGSVNEKEYKVLPVPEEVPDAVLDFISRYQNGEAPAVSLEDGIWSVLPAIYARESAKSGTFIRFPDKLEDLL